jgi:hypothetical protein
MNFLTIATIGVGSWMVINGILHDIFVLRSEHGKVYNRDLLRLLMDGHILITCGAIQILSYKGIEGHQHWAYYTCAIVCLSLLVYCAMIFPFLKSIVTMILNLALLILLIMGL